MIGWAQMFQSSTTSAAAGVAIASAVHTMNEAVLAGGASRALLSGLSCRGKTARYRPIGGNFKLKPVTPPKKSQLRF